MRVAATCLMLAACAATAAHADGLGVLAVAPDGGTVVHGGQILADILAWGATAFGTALAAFAVRVVAVLTKQMGVNVTKQQRDILQAVVLNGINDGVARARASLSQSAKLDFNAQRRVVQSAIRYTQTHAKDTITALGLDPESGDAVEAIRARIATAVQDPAQHTDPGLTTEAVGAVPTGH